MKYLKEYNYNSLNESIIKTIVNLLKIFNLINSLKKFFNYLLK